MISIIAAYNNNKIIGRDGKIPWHLPEDLKRFKEFTMGSPIIMGRKTWESIGRPLPGRSNIVVTSQSSITFPTGVDVAPTYLSAMIGAMETYSADEIFIIGGEKIYRQALPYADKMYLTHVYDDAPGDTVFPDFNIDMWDITFAEKRDTHTFRVLDRRRNK